jgi:DNA-binding NarL/FixJ family response regulator
MKVVIIDDEKAMHLIMTRMLAKINEVEVVESFQETSSAFAYMTSNHVDLVFVDINMPRESGLDFAKRLRDAGWSIKLVFVTSHKEYALSAFDVFAFDYIVKPISQERLWGTVTRAISEKSSQGVVTNRAALHTAGVQLIESLTKREIEILQLMSNGMSNKEIAAALELTEGTIKNHGYNIFGKLEVKNRIQATTLVKAYKLIN